MRRIYGRTVGTRTMELRIVQVLETVWTVEPLLLVSSTFIRGLATKKLYCCLNLSNQSACVIVSVAVASSQPSARRSALSQIMAPVGINPAPANPGSSLLGFVECKSGCLPFLVRETGINPLDSKPNFLWRRTLQTVLDNVRRSSWFLIGDGLYLRSTNISVRIRSVRLQR